MKKRIFWLFVITIGIVSGHVFSQSFSCLNYPLSDIKGDTCTEILYGKSLEGNLLNTPVIQKAKIYLPPNYDMLSRNKYPVLYLLVGYGDDENAYYQYMQLFERLNELITSLKIKPMIVVTPNSWNKYMGSWFTNSYVTGKWEDYITYDLPHHIDTVYKVNNNKGSRGLSGYGSGGYGTLRIGMKHPSVFGTIGSMNVARADFNNLFSDYWKPYMTSAAIHKDYEKADTWQEKACFSMAAAFAPDSTEIPSLCRIPCTETGEKIESIWQQWLEHDPISMLSLYKDSLLLLNSMLMYIREGDKDFVTNESFHQTLLDNNIIHTYRVFEEENAWGPMLDNLLPYFSDNLNNSIPTIVSHSEYSLKNNDSICVDSDIDGTFFIIPYDIANNFEKIVTDYKISTNAYADSLVQIPLLPLSGLDYNKYQVFAMSQDSSLSNVPVEFTFIDHTSINYSPIRNSLRLYPNPAYSFLNLETDISDRYCIEITTVNGHQILNKEMEGTIQQIDLSSFRKGIYFITIRSKDFVTTRKVIKL